MGSSASFWRFSGKSRNATSQSSSLSLTLAPSLRTSEWCCFRHLRSLVAIYLFNCSCFAETGWSSLFVSLSCDIDILNFIALQPSDSLLKLDSFVVSWLSSVWISAAELIWLNSLRVRLPRSGIFFLLHSYCFADVILFAVHRSVEEANGWSRKQQASLSAISTSVWCFRTTDFRLEFRRVSRKPLAYCWSACAVCA